ncbi:MAG: FAD-dependent oxidoreductase [Rhodothermales bacterium]|nr:FAD-dependent oxidoreductase [Rhodothermales bacterium]
MTESPDIIVVGAGVFGLTSALELARRGHSVVVVDPGPIPHPLAASTDISKVVRMEYGKDVQYMEMVEQALPGFRAWNRQFGEPLYHETGVTMFTRQPMAPGQFEYESFHLLKARGHDPQRLQARELQERFPAWSEAYVDGFFHAEGGYVESGRLIAALAREARSLGIEFVEAKATRVGDGTVSLSEGDSLSGGLVLVAAGTWSHLLVPELAPMMRSTGHPVFHLEARDPDLFSPPAFGTFMADVAGTGWYGFPYNPRERVIKVANHGLGLRLHPERDARRVYPDDIESLRSFLAMAFPALADARVVYTRRCVYCDTLDEHFWIDRHPEKPRLAVATGGSGHGMKFAPVLGPLIADAIEGVANPWLERFRWRPLDAATRGEEAARHRA